MNHAELEQLVNSYKNATPEELASVFQAASEETTKGLEALVLANQEAYQRIVPQIFDPQTRLYTKTWFERVKLPDAISKSESYGAQLSYVLFDLDNFHRFNEMYGHLMGDRAVELFSSLLREKFRTSDRRKIGVDLGDEHRTGVRKAGARYSDIMGRLPNGEIPQGRVGYGEEFAVVLYNCDEEHAMTRVNEVLEEVRKIRIPYLDEKVSFTVSAGVAQYQPGMTPKQLIANADKALMYSKSNSKDKATSFSHVPPDFNLSAPTNHLS